MPISLRMALVVSLLTAIALAQPVPQSGPAPLSGLRRDAEQGDPKAQYLLGGMYSYGRGVPQDYTEAARWYRSAAEQGEASAQYSLGRAHYKGQGVPQDYAEALRW